MYPILEYFTPKKKFAEITCFGKNVENFPRNVQIDYQEPV